MLAGIFNVCNKWVSQIIFLILNNMVLDALLTSVACTLPLVNFHISQQSIVPHNNLFSSANCRAFGIVSKIHLIFVPEK